jgi:hypothetical protein
VKDPRRVARQVSGLVGASRRAGRAYGTSPLRAALIARRLRRRQAYEYEEALRLGLLDPAIPEDVRARYVSRHAGLEAAGPLNHGNVVPRLSGDKGVFYRYCAAWGIPTPELYGMLDRRGASWSAAGGFFRDRAGFVRFVERDLPGEFVVKPSWSGMGEGVRALRKDGDALVDFDGEVTSAGDLWDALAADPEHDEWVVQERMRNHPDLVALGGDDGVHGVRIVTLVGGDGTAELLFAFLKLSIAGHFSDNFLGGTTGNGVAEVSLADGRVGPLLVPDPDRPGIGFRRLSHSPLTGAPVEGVVLPHWREACRLVLDAAPRFVPTRALGWDVALSPRGPVTFEANTRWLLLPLPSMRPVYERVLAASGAPGMNLGGRVG